MLPVVPVWQPILLGGIWQHTERAEIGATTMTTTVGCSISAVISVLDAAHRTGRNPETIRRWIREGRLRARKVGARHMIDEADLDAATEEPRSLPTPHEWQTLPSGRPAPDWVKALDAARGGR